MVTFIASYVWLFFFSQIIMQAYNIRDEAIAMQLL